VPAFDVEAQVRGWVADEAQKQSFTDRVAWTVTVDRVGHPTPQGIRMAMQWTIGLSIETGLLTEGQKWLNNTMTIDRPVPEEKYTRDGVRQVIEGLRKHRIKLRSGQNGHGKLPAGKT
jgi:hypothetical protein